MTSYINILIATILVEIFSDEKNWPMFRVFCFDFCLVVVLAIMFYIIYLLRKKKKSEPRLTPLWKIMNLRQHQPLPMNFYIPKAPDKRNMYGMSTI